MNDDIVESCEEFSVSLTTTINPRIEVVRSEVGVTLFDDEGVETYCTVVIYMVLVTFLRNVNLMFFTISSYI